MFPQENKTETNKTIKRQKKIIIDVSEAQRASWLISKIERKDFYFIN